MANKYKNSEFNKEKFNLNYKKFEKDLNFISCKKCKEKYINFINNGCSLNANKKFFKKLSKNAKNIINNKHEFLFALNNFKKRLKNFEFDIIEKKDVRYLCPWHLVIQKPENPEKYFRVVNNASKAMYKKGIKILLSLNDIIDDKYAYMKVPNLKDYARLIDEKAGNNGAANLTDLTAAFHQLTLTMLDRGLICFNVCGVYLRARKLEWGVKPASAICQQFSQFLIWIFENCNDNNNIPYIEPKFRGCTTVHIDDFIQVWNNRKECLYLGKRLLQCLDEHGVKYDKNKTLLNVQHFKHHGAIWDLNLKNVSVTDKMIKWLIKAIKLVINESKFGTVKFWYMLCGRLMYVSAFYIATKSLISNIVWYIIDIIKKYNLSKNDIIEVNNIIIFDLQYWLKFIYFLKRVPIKYFIKKFQFEFKLYTDASKFGIGIYFNGLCISAQIPNNMLSWHINCKEAFAALVAINHFKYEFANKCGILYVDNTVVKDSFARKWSKNPRLMNCIYLICIIMMEVKCVIYFDWISTEKNCMADALSRFDVKKLFLSKKLFNFKIINKFILPSLNFDFTNAEKLFNKRFNK